jgi:hypothetical protein
MLVVATLFGNDEENGVLGSGTNPTAGVPTGSNEGTLYAVVTPSLIGLATQGNWQATEFNIFGNSSGSNAQFDSSASAVDQILMQTTPPTTNPPACNAGTTTGESSNLNILNSNNTCCRMSGIAGDPTIGIQFTESVSGVFPQACPVSSQWSWTQPFPSSSCAQAIVPGGLIACTGTNAPNNFAVLQVNSQGQGQFIGGYAKTITVDDTGVPWVVTAIGTIFQYIGNGNWKAISAVSPAGAPWLSVSVGTPLANWDTWAVDTANHVYVYSGGQFLPVLGAPAAKKVTQFDAWMCNSNNAFHAPMILGTNNEVYVPQETTFFGLCTDPSVFTTFTIANIIPGDAGIADITTGGWALGNDQTMYLYSVSGSNFRMAGPMSGGNGFSGATVHIGNNYWNYPGPILSQGPWGINTNGQIQTLAFQ